MIVDQFYQETLATLRLPEAKGRVKRLGLNIIGNTYAEFSVFINLDQKKWVTVVKGFGARVD